MDSRYRKWYLQDQWRVCCWRYQRFNNINHKRHDKNKFALGTEMQPAPWWTKWAQTRVEEEEDISGEQMWEPEQEREEQRRDRQRDGPN